MASTRLPGKPLADIAGQPMIVHCLRRAEEAEIGPVIVACAELCGLGHYRMRAFLSVRSEADFQTWLSEQSQLAQAN